MRRIVAVIVVVAALTTAQQAAASCHTVAYKARGNHWVWQKKTRRVHGRRVVVRRHGNIVYVHVRVGYIKTRYREVCTETDTSTVSTVGAVAEECGERPFPPTPPGRTDYFCFYTITPRVAARSNGQLIGAQVELNVLAAGELGDPYLNLPTGPWTNVANGQSVRIKVEEEVSPAYATFSGLRSCAVALIKEYANVRVSRPYSCPEGERFTWLIYARSEFELPVPWDSSYSGPTVLRARP
jgi:hypothetical protein